MIKGRNCFSNHSHKTKKWFWKAHKHGLKVWFSSTGLTTSDLASCYHSDPAPGQRGQPEQPAWKVLTDGLRICKPRAAAAGRSQN